MRSLIQRCLLCFLTISTMLSCRSDLDSMFTESPFIVPLISDTLVSVTKPMKINSQYIFSYDINALCKFGDTCLLSKNNLSFYGEDDKVIREKVFESVEVFVDTSQTVSMNYFIGSFSLDDTVKEGFCKGYPCFIFNKIDSAMMMYTHDEKLVALQEALNKDSVWCPIQANYFFRCGYAYGKALVPPGYYLLTKVPLYEGSFLTSIWVKLYNDGKLYYSNIYKACINPDQFKKSMSWKYEDPDLSYFKIR